MRSVAYLPALVALASAGPLLPRQDIDIAALKAAEDPIIVTVTAGTPQTTVAYNLPSATAQAVENPTDLSTRDIETVVVFPQVEKRSACEPQPAGSGPAVTPDTAEAFVAFDAFKSAAEGASVPSGYVQTFSNLKASLSAYGYLGYTALESYDTALCASKCDAITGCAGM